MEYETESESKRSALYFWRLRYASINSSCADTGILKEETYMPEAMRQVCICLRPPPLLGFWFGWSSNFVGSESGQIQSVKLLQNMVSNRNRHPSQPSQPQTVYCTLTHRWGGEGVEPERRLEGQQFTKLG